MFAELSIFVFGILRGMRHALDADHIAAVSTIVAEETSVRRSSMIGAIWGAGHSMTLVLIGIPVLLFRSHIPESFSHAVDGVVGVVLIAMGGSLLYRILSQKIHWHGHVHDDQSHAHAHSHDQVKSHAHAHFDRFARRSFLVGILHGLAGSGGLTILILATMHSAAEGIIFLGLFSVGTLIGMMLLTTTIGIPFSISKHRLTSAAQLLSIVTGALGTAIGFDLLITNFWQLWRG